ncbi:MAG: type II methionyl aminopeptidase [Candidatus Thermoplasmatota archaeon]
MESRATAIQSPQDLANWVRAGQVAADALRHGRTLTIPGARVIDVAAGIESVIRDAGLGFAFPATLSLNHVAAHVTPPAGDATVLKEGDLVKLDCGAELNGALSDNALTIEVGYPKNDGPCGRLIDASAACLKEAIGILGPNVDLGTVGAAIEMTAKEFGFKTIQNLTGHSLEPYNLHAGLTVPNCSMKVGRRPRIGDVLACEPFVTDGASGRVENAGPGHIYHFQANRPLRLPAQRTLAAAVAKRHPKLPFAGRWLNDLLEPSKLQFNLQQLQKEGVLKHYPALAEASGGMVAQTEATIVITESGCEVTTKPSTP